MIKKLVIIIFIIFLCGCSNKIVSNVGTIIEEEDNYVIAINYPITNTKLDKYIEKEIFYFYDDFKNSSNDKKLELNIDYEFYYINHYINVVLYIYKEESNYIKTFVYDIKKKKLLEINDILEDKEIIDEIIEVKFQKRMNYQFIFDHDNLTIFLENKEEIQIPLSDLDLKIHPKKKDMIQTVQVNIPEKVIDPNSKMVALTFDDGPSKYTEEIVEILKKNDCVATFFVLGNKVTMYSDILIKSLNYGNEIGNHSYNHKWLIKLKEDEIKEQINKTQDIIKEYTGYIPRLLRPTYGSVNDIIRHSSNLDIVLWNVDTLDWKYKSSDRIVKNATKNLKDGNIILMHDTHKQTVEALPKIIEIIKKNGFKCVTISELKEANFIKEKLNE